MICTLHPTFVKSIPDVDVGGREKHSVNCSPNKTFFTHLSITKDCCRPGKRRRRYQKKPGVYAQGKDVVEVVDDADNKSNAGNNEKQCPKSFPAWVMSQIQVVKSVS